MIAALLYLQVHSLRNRIIGRLKRLRQPKYLVGAIVGGMYIYFYFFRWIFIGRHGGGVAAMTSGPGDSSLQESIVALVLFGVVLLSWILPNERAALAFSEAEVAFLFPAPITRRELIQFKLLRSQAGILFTTVLLSLITNRFGGAGRIVIHMAGWWLMLSLLNLHFLGASFARTALLDRGVTHWKRRLAVLALALIGLGVVVGWTVHTLPALDAGSLADPRALAGVVHRALVSGPFPYLLYPFRLVIRPYLATDATGFLLALGPVVLLMAAHYVWVVRADVAFEERSVDASRKLAEKIAAIRAGKRQGVGRPLKRRRAPFRLAPVGWRPVAVFWKNLTGMKQSFPSRVWVVMLCVAVLVIALGGSSLPGRSAWSVKLEIIGSISSMLGAMLLLIGPQIAGPDFRHDLPQADMLKLFPMRGWQVALGEVLAPAVVLTVVQWALLAVAAGCFAFGIRGMSGGLIAASAAGAAIVLPMFNVISLVVPNAAVLLFPGWFQTGRDAPRGIEATGQRIIFALGQLMALGFALIPGAAVFAGAFMLLKLAVGGALAVPLASIAATGILSIEAGLGIWLLGWLFERLDISDEVMSTSAAVGP